LNEIKRIFEKVLKKEGQATTRLPALLFFAGGKVD